MCCMPFKPVACSVSATGSLACCIIFSKLIPIALCKAVHQLYNVKRD